ncbi:hypothetical protein CRM22_010030 [Opisthorchis felineus]|uniref:Uncharacterized protein n=1 Tax=Opisthorchis felineus TaxID=147828 RepID=A0A4S2L4D2_OPIFE|nr:hypothetical protein CRM22_010030 [Opisthorchis felineus]
MTVDRNFLDLFWAISGQDRTKRYEAIEQLLSSLTDNNGKAKPEYVDYTKERLVKGLKSFSTDARIGFSQTLCSLLCKHPSLVTNSQLLELFNKHIYSTAASSTKEEKSVKYAYILCPRVLCEADRVTQLKLDQIKPVVDRFLSLSSTSNLKAEILSVSQLLVSKLPPKLVHKLFSDFAQKVWQLFSLTDSELLGDQLLFLLRLRRRLKGLDVGGLPASFDLSSKMFRRKLIKSFQHSTGDTILSLVDEAVEQTALKTIWPKLSGLLCDENASVRCRKTLMQIASHIICQHGDDWTRYILSEPVILVLIRQMSKPTLSCFEDACSLMRQCLQTVCAPYTKKRAAVVQPAEPMDSDDGRRSTSPSTLFSCFAEFHPTCDLICAHSAPKPLQFLMNFAHQAIGNEALVSYANKLVRLFIQPKSFTVGHPDLDAIDQNVLRSFAAFQLQRVLWCILRPPTSSVLLGSIEQFLTFFVTFGLTIYNLPLPAEYQSETPIGRSVANTCWLSFFRLLTQLASHSEGAVQKSHDKVPAPHSLLSDSLLLVTKAITELLDATIDQLETSVPRLSSHLHQSISLLKKARSEDKLGLAMANLHAVTLLYYLSNPSDTLNVLIDDLAECFKRRRNCHKGHPLNDGGPAWPSVLTDVVLGLISNPSIMLRSFARTLFDQLIVSGDASKECVRLICDVSNIRVDRRSVKKVDGDDEEEAEGLIAFSDEELDTAEEKDDADEELDAETGPNSEISEDKEVNETESDQSEQSISDPESDDDLEEQIDMDEAHLTSFRERIKTALGPAALGEDEVDSTSYREFTDAEMFAQDEALAAAFRANRLSTPKRTIAERARSLGQLKMRCLDQFECILQHSSQPEVFWPTITHMLNLAKEACVAERKTHPTEKQDPTRNLKKLRQRLSDVARSGDLPGLQRVLEILKRVTSRGLNLESQLTKATLALPNVAETLATVTTAIVDASKVGSPQPYYLNVITAITQFVFHVASACSEPEGLLVTVSEPLLEEFLIYVTSTRKSSIAGGFFLTLLHQSQVFATQATPLMLDAFFKFLESASSSNKAPDGAQLFAHTNCCNALGMLFQALAEKRYDDSYFSKVPKRIFTRSIRFLSGLDYDSVEDVRCFVWFSKLSVATAVFNLLTWATKVARKQGFELILEPKLIQILRNLPCKSVIRKPARKFANFFNQSVNAEGLSKEEKQAIKAQRKQARRARRKEKALLRQEKLVALNKSKGAERVKTTQNGIEKPKARKPLKTGESHHVPSLKRKHTSYKRKDTKKQKLS